MLCFLTMTAVGASDFVAVLRTSSSEKGVSRLVGGFCPSWATLVLGGECLPVQADFRWRGVRKCDLSTGRGFDVVRLNLCCLMEGKQNVEQRWLMVYWQGGVSRTLGGDGD